MAANKAQDFSDNAMLDLFRAEVETHTQTLNEGLLALEKEPNQLKRIEPLMRAAHSIKGAARIVGVEDGVRVAHVMEDCLVAAQNGTITLKSEAIDILLRGVDALMRIASADQSGPEPPELDQLIEQIGSVRQEKSSSTKHITSPPEPVSAQLAGKPAIAVVMDGQTRTIGLPMHLDPATAELLRQTLLEQLDTGGRQLRLDLSALREIDVPGLALLSLLAQSLADRTIGSRPQIDSQVSLELVHVEADLAMLFQATGLEGLYQRKKARN